MTESTKILLFLKDYAERGGDRYFLFSNSVLSEVTAAAVVAEPGTLVCHDYWLIAPSLFKANRSLPACVVDTDVFAELIKGKRGDKKARARSDYRTALADICEKESLESYSHGYTQKNAFDQGSWGAVANALLIEWHRLCLAAGFSGELDRCLKVEFPVFNYLVLQAVRGIRIDIERLRSHRAQIEHDYYSALRSFGIKYDLPFEVPDNAAVKGYLEEKGFDFSGVSLDYVLKFVPMNDGFSEDLAALRKLENSRSVLWSLSLGRQIVTPMIDVFGTRTSRIYFRDPALQGLAKRHRDIIIPDEGFKLSYVDYDQFEVGIMAALSEDLELLALFALDDLYLEIAHQLFNDASKRAYAKRLFLSYAYGMPKEGLLAAAYAQGAPRSLSRSFFSKFQKYESWKRGVESTLLRCGRIGTEDGNYWVRDELGPLSSKEQRSAVSQVVQGTASLIFKKALLRLSRVRGVSLKMPMHDAILIQHLPGFDVSEVVKIMGDAVADHFNGRIVGKASIEPFSEI